MGNEGSGPDIKGLTEEEAPTKGANQEWPKR